MKEAICVFILVAPAVFYKLYKDWNGFNHESDREIWNLFFIMLISGFFAGLPYMDGSNPGHTHLWHFIFGFKKALVTITGFQLFFTCLMNWRLTYKFGYTGSRFVYIMNHLNVKVWPDKWVKGIHWSIRLIVYVSLFTASVIWFVR